jgi:hypothetical protein
MDQEQFEQLVSQWLDEPDRPTLRAAIRDAIAELPARAALRDQYVRLNELLWEALHAVPAVDWVELKQQILAELQRGAVVVCAGDEDSLDARLRELLPDPERRIDWSAFHKATSGRIAALARRERRQPRLARWVRSGVAGGLAAAAAIVLSLGMPDGALDGEATPVEAGAAFVRVSDPGPAAQQRGSAKTGPAVAVLVFEDGEAELQRLVDSFHQTSLARRDRDDPEVYFMLEPADESGVFASAGGLAGP